MRIGVQQRTRKNRGVSAIPIFLCFLLSAPLISAQTGVCVVKTPTTQGIQSAIDACAAKGGGVADVPPGQYITGPLWLKSNVELHLEAGAIINASHNPADWPANINASRNPADWSANAPALINAENVENIALTGEGTIDGKSQFRYGPVEDNDVEIAHEMELAKKAGVPLDRYYRTGLSKNDILFSRSRNIRLEGVRIQNASGWTIRLQDCNQVRVHGISVYSDLVKGVNEDGIDIVSTSNVFISDSTIITGDDAIVLKTTRLDDATPEEARQPVQPTENILVNNCLLSSSSTPMMIGTETFADIRDVIFSNIVVRDSNKVFGINVQDGATVSNVRFENVTFDLSRRAWNWWGSAEVFKFVLKKRNPDSKLGRIENITIDGAQGTARGTSLAEGLTERPLLHIVVKGLHVKMLPEGTPDLRTSDALVFENIDDLALRDVQVTWDKEHPQSTWGSALVLKNINGLTLGGFQGEAGSKNPSIPAIRKDHVVMTHEVN